MESLNWLKLKEMEAQIWMMYCVIGALLVTNVYLSGVLLLAACYWLYTWYQASRQTRALFTLMNSLADKITLDDLKGKGDE